MTDNLQIDYDDVSPILNSNGTPLITDANGDVTAIMWVGNAGDLGSGQKVTIITVSDINWLDQFINNNKTALDDIICCKVDCLHNSILE